MDEKLFEIIDKINEKIGDINVKIAGLPSREEVKQIVVDQICAKSKVDWKEITKLTAMVLGGGGIGATIAEVIKALG